MMISNERFFQALEQLGVDLLTGVPDSLLKSFCAYASANLPANRHVISANEGGAVALAAGHYLATGRTALVYMQNSGQGNAVNPLLSLADPDVYGIPMLLLVGWRGEPGVKDEPQHVKQGRVTQALFEAMNIPCRILPADTEGALDCLAETHRRTLEEKRPGALLVRADSFEPFVREKEPCPYTLKREDAIAAILGELPAHAAVVATTGHISRELYEYRDRQADGHARDFLTVGSMGHASQIALGIALRQPARPVVCLDGDGAALMHLGALAITGTSCAKNFRHILLNNGVHDSVGAQKTVGFEVHFVQIAHACGYRDAVCVETAESLHRELQRQLAVDGPAFMEIRVAPGARKNLGRPKTRPDENRDAFMAFLNSPIKQQEGTEKT